MASNVYKIEWEGSVYEVEAESEEEAYSVLPGYGAPAAAAPAAAPPAAAPQNAAPATTQQRATDMFGNSAVDEGLDIAATLGSSSLALIPSGIAGIAGAALPGEQGQGKRWQEAVASAGTWSPKTEGAQAVLGSAGKGMEWLSTNVIKPVMENMSRGPMTPTEAVKAAQKLLDGKLPDTNPLKAAMAEAISGTFMPGKTAVKAGAAKEALNVARGFNRKEHADAATRLGIDLENSSLKGTTIEAARVAGGGSGDGPDLSRATVNAEEMALTVKAKAEASRKAVDAGYTIARSKDAAIAYEPVAAMIAKTQETLFNRGLRADEMPVVARRIAEISEINEKIIGRTGEGSARVVPGQSVKILGSDKKPLRADAPVRIPLNELESVNATLSQNIRDARVGKRPVEAEALSTLRRDLNAMLDEQFMKDMVFGDQSAKDAWTRAKGANRAHKARFSDDKVIASIVKNEYNSSQVVKLILGASEVGHRAEAVGIVRKLKGILGTDSEQLSSIRSAVYLDMFDPLFKDKPNWTGTLERMRRIRKNDGALLRALGISEKDLDFFEKAIKVSSNVKVKADLDGRGFASQMIARFGFGHDIAVGGARMKIANLILDKALRVGQKTHAQLLSEFANDEGVTSALSASLSPAKTRQILEKAALAAYLEREKDQRDR